MAGGGENPVLKIPKYYSTEIRASSLEILVISSDVFVIILWPRLAPALCPHQDSQEGWQKLVVAHLRGLGRYNSKPSPSFSPSKALIKCFYFL